MSTDEARAEAAAALRDLIHAFAAHDADDAELRAIASTAASATTQLERAPLRDRMALMRKAVAAGTEPSFPAMTAGSGFSDRAVGGQTNPTSVDVETRFEGEEVVATVVLRAAFEGAPGRAHGGIVAAAFDDVTGFVIGMLREPAFTGELTVRYVKPVPVNTPLEMRARLRDRERRKLFIEAECHDGDELVATCKAIYITVDPTRFAGAPDPR
jgi:acyl-coenzyme A thioesterase PaaI-like protein